MISKSLKKMLEKKTDNALQIARMVIRNKKLLQPVLEGLSSVNARVKFKSAKVLSLISQVHPKLIYPHFDYFAKLLGHENNIIKWNAIKVIGNLAAVDYKNKFNKIFSRFYGLLKEGSLITAAHVVDNSAKIARANTKLINRITDELIKVGKIHLPTGECRNILKAKTIEAFSRYAAQIKDKGKILLFVKKEIRNRRNATRVRAHKFLKKFKK